MHVSSMKLRSLLGPVLLGAGLMTAAATSSAAIYRGNWDPSFGAPYPDLGFRGFVDLLVPASVSTAIPSRNGSPTEAAAT